MNSLRTVPREADVGWRRSQPTRRERVRWVSNCSSRLHFMCSAIQNASIGRPCRNDLSLSTTHRPLSVSVARERAPGFVHPLRWRIRSMGAGAQVAAAFFLLLSIACAIGDAAGVVVPLRRHAPAARRLLRASDALDSFWRARKSLATSIEAYQLSLENVLNVQYIGTLLVWSQAR